MVTEALATDFSQDFTVPANPGEAHQRLRDLMKEIEALQHRLGSSGPSQIDGVDADPRDVGRWRSDLSSKIRSMIAKRRILKAWLFEQGHPTKVGRVSTLTLLVRCRKHFLRGEEDATLVSELEAFLTSRGIQ